MAMLISMTIIFLAVVLAVHANYSEVPPCPEDCTCYDEYEWLTIQFRNIQLIICSNRTSDKTTDFDQYLSESEMSLIDEMYLLKSPLTELPTSICNLTKLHVLDLIENRLHGLPSNCFHRMENLTTIRSNRNQISVLQAGLFEGLRNLRELSLTNNRLTTLEVGVFEGLERLRTIYLEHNNITELHVGLFKGVRSLRELSLANNRLTSLDVGVFEGLNELQTIKLDYNKITELRVGLFNGLAKLETLMISHNEIASLQVEQFSDLRKLLSLYLTANRITHIRNGTFAGLTSLRVLRLDHNQLEELKSGVFDDLHNLITINVSYNRIKSMDNSVFSEISDLSAIYLHNNQLDLLEPWPMIIDIQTSLGFYNIYSPGTRVIELSHNRISNFTNTVGWSYDCYDLPDEPFELHIGYNEFRHFTDMLIAWNMSRYNTDCLGAKVTYNMAGNFSCDCTDYSYYSYDRDRRYPSFFSSSEAYCETPDELKGTLISKVPLNRIKCDVTERCPLECRCVLRPKNETFSIYCSNTNVSSLPAELPILRDNTTKYSLDFSNNRRLSFLQKRSYFADACLVDFSHCSIVQIDISNWALLLRIDSVLLNNNQLQSLPHEITSFNVTTKHLRLYDNPWLCTCENNWVSRWMILMKNRLDDVSKIKCQLPEKMLGKILIASDLEFCPTDPQFVVDYTLALVITGLVVLVVLTFLVARRWRVQIFVRWHLHPFDRDECAGEDMEFDVFLCCSSQDHNPDAVNLVELLESSGYRVCYHVRDFVGGEPILASISRAIEKSRRTVFLLTQHFIESSFCITEFDFAFHHNTITLHKNRIVVLMMLDSPSATLNADAVEAGVSLDSLRQYIRLYTYINCSKGDWKHRLMYALPISRIPNNDRHA